MDRDAESQLPLLAPLPRERKVSVGTSRRC